MSMVLLSASLRAQDVDSLAAYFPLAVGNIWQYTYYTVNSPAGPSVVASYSIEIDGDTVMPNGRHYVHAIGRAVGHPPLYMAMPTGYVRYTLDPVSAAGGLLLYDPATGSEMGVGDWFHPSQLRDHTRGIVFGESVDVITFGHDIGANADTCARGFGIVRTSLGDCEEQIAPCETHVLVYAKIDGREYGQFLSAPPVAADPATSLAAPFPNPFATSASIPFTLGHRGHVRLDVVSALGEEVATLVDGEMGAGAHAATLDGAGLPEGLYIVRLRVGGMTLSGRLVLTR